MGAAAIVTGLIILGLVLGTYVLQALILLVVAAVQIAGWLLTGLIGGGYMLWLAITDRSELARVWRNAHPARRRQAFG